ncbi:MAG: DUF3987 domain-containing protein [Rhizonema sp. NSF051]|nr:DUF3987 domain-containing protein [Rhizonema sp. NSF051]
MNLRFHQLPSTTDNTVEKGDHIQTRIIETSNLSNCLNDNSSQVSVTKTPTEGQKCFPSKPVFWIPDDLYLSALHFNKLFEVRGYKEVSGEIPALENYIIQSSDMKEATIKAIAWKIQAHGGRCKIYSSQLEFTSLVGEETSITEVTLQIHDYALEYDDWAVRRDKENLTVRQASEIARVALALLPKAQKLVELGILRERCKQSSWEWSKLVMELEEQFQREVERRGVGGSGGEPPIVESRVIDRTLEIIGRGLSPSAEKDAIASLAQDVNRQPKHIEDLAQLLRVEMDLEELSEEMVNQQLPSLLQSEAVRLNLHDYLWADGGTLAQAMIDTACSMPTAPEFLFTTFIPTAGSRLGTAASIVVDPNKGYVQPAIFRTCIVANSGDLKSPAQKQIIQPLIDLETEAYKQYQEDFKRYKQDLAVWEKNKDSLEKPEMPIRRRYLLQNGSLEARIAIHNENPQGLLLFRDEWSAHLTGRNKHRQGVGDDAENELSEFDGSAIIKDVMNSHERLYLAQSAISRTGSTQTGKLKELMKDHGDTTGEFARWLFDFAPCPIPYLDLFSDSGAAVTLREKLTRLYQDLGTMPEKQYFLAQESKLFYQDFANKLVDLGRQEQHPGIAIALPKLRSYFARFCLFIHCVNEVLAGNALNPSLLISPRTVRASAKLCEYYLCQLRLVYAINSPQQEFAGRLLTLKKWFAGKVGVTARDIKRVLGDYKKLSSNELDADLKTLVKAGVLTTLNNGKTTKYSCVTTNSSLLSPTVTPTVTPIVANSLKPKTIGNKGEIDIFKNEPSPTVTASVAGVKPDGASNSADLDPNCHQNSATTFSEQSSSAASGDSEL